MTAIYILRDPKTHEVRYVGQASDPEQAYDFHITSGSKGAMRNWVVSLEAQEMTPKLEIVATVEDYEAQAEERRWRSHLTQTGCHLITVNNTDPAEAIKTVAFTLDIETIRLMDDIAALKNMSRAAVVRYMTRKLAQIEGVIL